MNTNVKYGIHPSVAIMLCLLLFMFFSYNHTTAQPLKVGIYQNSPKVFIDSKGKPKGIFIDLMEEIARKESWELEYVFGTWNQNLERLKSSEIDILLDVAYSEERAANFKLNSIFVVDDWLEVYVHKSKSINSITELYGKKIALVKGAIQEQFLINEIADKFELEFLPNLFPDYPSAAQSLLEDSSDVMIGSRFFYFSKERHVDIWASSILLRPTQAYFAFPKESDQGIINAIDKNLVKLKNDPRSVYYKSLKYWLKTFHPSIFPKYIYFLSIITVCFLILIGIFALFLKREVKVRTYEIQNKNAELKQINSKLEQIVAEYKNAEEELSKFRFMVENARQEIYLVKKNGDIVYANNSVCNSLGYTSQEIFAGGIKLFDPLFGYKYQEHFDELKRTELPPFETIHYTKDGRKLIKQIKSFYLNIGSQEYICGLAEDITLKKKREKELQESQQLFRTLANMSPVGIFRTQSNGYTTYVNPRWCELSGISAEDAQGDSWFNAVHPDDRERVMKEWRERSSKGEHSEAEYRFLKDDGKEVWVLGYALPELDGNEIVGYIGTLTDITERKQTELILKQKSQEIKTQYEKYKQLIDLATDAFFHGDSMGNLIMVNRIACKLTGYSSEELLKMNMKDLFSQEEINKKPLRYDLLNQGMILKNERQVLTKDKKSIFVEMNSKKMPDGTYQSFFIDITERKEAELLLKQKNEEIETQNEEYRQLNEELNLAKAKAEESDRLKSAFLANMSHEIRTPMNAICGFSRLLERENIKENKRKEYIEIINTNSLHLLGIINDIVDISKIESGLVSLSKQSFNLNDLLDEILSTHSTSTGLSNVNILCKKGLPDSRSIINADKVKLRQVINNLIINAIKFTPTGKIKFGYSLTSSNLLEFYVRDTGIGIPPTHLNQIFERFHQVEGATTDSRKGTGLGLAISKGFVELMGGEIWAQSEMGKGSTFFFSIPYTVVEDVVEKMEKIPNPKGYRWEGKIILIAEDDEPTQFFLAEILSDTGASIITVDNGVDAVMVCKENKQIDIVLMDIKLQKLSGLDATIEIRLFRPNLPIIAQTAYAFSSDIQKAISAGCTAYITKPLDKETLLETINLHLR